MPEKKTVATAKKDKAEGKAPSTQAGEFVREEIHHVREGKHGARSTKQAIAIGLSKARRAGVKLNAPEKGTTTAKRPPGKKSTRTQAKRDLAKGKTAASRKKAVSKTRSRATTKALKKEPRRAASSRALSRHAKQAARRRPNAGKNRAGTRSADEGGRKTVAR